MEHGGMRWYAVFCKPRQESIAQENLARQGFKVYLPRIRARQNRRGQWVDTVDALFPRYLFICVDAFRQSTHSVRSTRGAVGLVRFAGQPAVVPEIVIEALSRREDAESGLFHDDRTSYCPGQPIRLIGGPISDVEGIFLQQDGEHRAIVLLELFGKANKVRVKRDWISKAA